MNPNQQTVVTNLQTLATDLQKVISDGQQVAALARDWFVGHLSLLGHAHHA